MESEESLLLMTFKSRLGQVHVLHVLWWQKTEQQISDRAQQVYRKATIDCNGLCSPYRRRVGGVGGGTSPPPRGWPPPASEGSCCWHLSPLLATSMAGGVCGWSLLVACCCLSPCPLPTLCVAAVGGPCWLPWCPSSCGRHQLFMAVHK